MNYDFQTLKNRRGTGSEKWNEMLRAYPDVPEDVVPLSVADMEFLNPPEIAKGIADYAADNILGYTYPTRRYYSSVLNWMKVHHDWEPEKKWIVEYPGVVSALFQLCAKLTGPGDGIIIMPPVYYPFALAVENSGARLVNNPLLFDGERYTIDFEDLERKAADPANKLLIFCSPHNPVGRVWTGEELAAVGDICVRNGVTVICDEIHNDLIMPGYNHITFASGAPEAAAKGIICTAPSKTFNLAGMQLSNIFIQDDELRKAAVDAKMAAGIMGCNILAYEACTVAYNECGPWLDQLIHVLEENRRFTEAFLAAEIPCIKPVPLEGTYLQWLDCRELMEMLAEGSDSDSCAKEHILEHFMKEKANMFFDEGYVFGKEGIGFERLNLACPKAVLEKALIRLRDAVNSRLGKSR